MTGFSQHSGFKVYLCLSLDFFLSFSGMVWNPIYGLSHLSGIEEWFTDRSKSNNKVFVNEDCPKSSGMLWL